MRRALVAANWKMNGSLPAIAEFARDLAQDPASLQAEHADVVIFPPALYIQAFVDALTQSGLAAGAGAQDVGISASGAHTGEIAAEMVREVGGSWTIVGHSERRIDQQETDDLVATKAAAALRGGLQPVICVGETLAERQAGQEISVVERQLDAVLDRIEAVELVNAAIGYEPVWAIGTGETATPDQAQVMHAFIRSRLAEADADAARQIRSIYGGSVKPDNAVELFSEMDIDGGLVGGASLDAASFSAIIAAANNCALRKGSIEGA